MSNCETTTLPTLEVEQHQVREVLRCLLHTIIFNRALGAIKPVEVDSELFDVTYVQVGDAAVDAKVEDKIDQFKAWVEKHPGKKGQVCLSFFEKRKKQSWSLIASKQEERLYWEQWCINITILEPSVSIEEQTSLSLSSARGQRHTKLQAAVEEGMSFIIRTVNDKKDHIPPVVSSAVVTFPFDITIAGSKLCSPTNQGWEGKGRYFNTSRSIPKGPKEPFLHPTRARGRPPRLVRLLQKWHVKCPVRRALDGWKHGRPESTATHAGDSDVAQNGEDMSSSGCLCWPSFNRRTIMFSKAAGLSAAQQLLEEKLAHNAAAVNYEYDRLRVALPRSREAINPYSAAQHPQNMAKNRYSDVLPYDKTRVRLAASGTDLAGTPVQGPADYINASYLRNPDASSSRVESWPSWEYIAAQGPLPRTTADFWELAYEQGCSIILMLTNTVELNIVKCADYLPKALNTPEQYGAFYVTVTSISEFSEDIRQRQIVLQRVNNPGSARHITHYHYYRWPDHGCPQTTRPLRHLAHVVEQRTMAAPSGPPLVHCSAGIGRTGTFCTVDIALRRLHAVMADRVRPAAAKQAVDLKFIVQCLRRQRQGMVQTKSQYLFCHQAVLEEVRELLALANGEMRAG